ncbi:hypothetical protein [Flavobacterium sp.]|uniref:hypothetical protein n=1 Tax=Flavobacterium sp. TaxID=239 RepID=UPI0037BF1BAF
MPLASLKLPPGLFRAGTEYQSAGRYYDADRVRWYAGTIQPMRGWRQRAVSALAGLARAALTWRDNTSARWAAVGTHTKLYALESGVDVYDITPAGFSTGRASASAAVGYGTGAYGEEAYGTPRTETSLTGTLPATVWSLDTWGENLVACSPDDGKLYEWTLNTAADAVAISGAPVDCTGLVVAEERILFALGASGDPRRVAWSDQEDNTDWTPVATNQAGSFTLTTPGQIVAGRRSRAGVLILTDVDAWLAQYQGPPFVYGFRLVGSECGVVSPGAIASTSTFNVWMGRSGFWLFDGYVKPLSCEVHDAVFGDINYAQISKATAVVKRAFGEVWFFYPSESSNENNRAVVWNYRENTWTMAKYPRTCGDDSGVFELPLLVSPEGVVYEHEVGWDYVDGATDYGLPYVEGGPLEIGLGERVMMARQLFPDEATQGGVTATFYTRFYPNGPESTHGPYTMSAPTNVRFSGRQARVRYTGSAPGDWRVGNNRLEGVPGSER